MKKIIALLFILSFSKNVFAYTMTYQEVVSSLPIGTYKGYLKSNNSSCNLKIRQTYSNEPESRSIEISTVFSSRSISLVKLSSTITYLKELNSVYAYEEEKAYAECCHSGGRDISKLELANNQLLSAQITIYEDKVTTDSRGRITDIQEVLKFNDICVLDTALKL